jgi:hypothetical protein
MYDCHIDLTDLKITHEHTSTIVHEAQQRNALVIYEGMADYNGDDPACAAIAKGTRELNGKAPWCPCKLLEYDVPDNFDGSSIPDQEWVRGMQASPLNVLAPEMTAANIAHKNVEFRHLLMATFIGTATFGTFFAKVEEVINTINAFDDDNAHCAFYENRIKDFKELNSDVYEHKQWRVKLNPALPLYQSVLGGTLERTVLYGWQLLEALTAHELYVAPDKDHVFIILGGLHAEHHHNAMKSFGYKQIREIGTRYWHNEKGRIAVHPLDLSAAFAETKTT